jgi:hypothetical protein
MVRGVSEFTSLICKGNNRMKLRDLTTIQWFGMIILFNTTLLGGSSQLGDLLLSPAVVKAILAVATLGNGFLGGLVTMFGGLGTQASNVVDGGASIAVGPFAKPPLAVAAMDPTQSKIDAAPGAASAVAAIAKAANAA